MHPHDIFKAIPHQRVLGELNNEEIFDLYSLGIFQTEDEAQENIELVELPPQATYQAHYHQHSSAIIYIVCGEGSLRLGKQFFSYKPSHRFVIPAKTLHGFKTETNTLFLSIQSPPIINPDNGKIDMVYEKEETIESY